MFRGFFYVSPLWLYFILVHSTPSFTFPYPFYFLSFFNIFQYTSSYPLPHRYYVLQYYWCLSFSFPLNPLLSTLFQQLSIHLLISSTPHRYYVSWYYWCSIILFSFLSFPEFHRVVSLWLICSTCIWSCMFLCLSFESILHVQEKTCCLCLWG
jgi:hypothetical protein